MNTKFLMTTCAVTLAAIGIVFVFLPAEILNLKGLTPTKTLQVLIQIVGGLYFGFGMLNWMAKDSLIGGIYNRPIVVANLAHFVIGALGLLKALMTNTNQPRAVWTVTVVYSLFAVSFGIVLFKHPLRKEVQE